MDRRDAASWPTGIALASEASPMSRQPNFERFKRALLLQGEPDCVPLAELAVDEDVRAAFLGGKREGAKGDVAFWTEAGYDYIPVDLGLRTVFKGRPSAKLLAALPSETRAALQSLRHQHTARYGHYRDESERKWANEGTGVIATRQAFDAFGWPRADQLDYTSLDEVGGALPEGMEIVGCMGEIMSLVYLLMGQENFYVSVHDDVELVERMYETIGAIHLAAVQTALRHERVRAIWIADDIAYSESPAHLRQYVFPWYKKIGDLCRRAQRPLVFHSDGRLYDVLDDLIDCGFNAIHPIEPKAMDIGYTKKTWGHKLCLIGNIDLGYTLTRGTPQEVEAEVKQRLREVAPGGGYCLGSSNSVTDFVPLQNYNAMREAVLRYGAYPIAL
jgi:uroporphyrinogen decarboxylase